MIAVEVLPAVLAVLTGTALALVVALLIERAGGQNRPVWQRRRYRRRGRR